MKFLHKFVLTENKKNFDSISEQTNTNEFFIYKFYIFLYNFRTTKETLKKNNIKS